MNSAANLKLNEPIYTPQGLRVDREGLLASHLKAIVAYAKEGPIPNHAIEMAEKHLKELGW